MTGTGRVALVTGAGRRLGRAMALALAEDGADVLVHHHTSGSEAADVVSSIRGMGRRAVAVAADGRIEGDVERVFATLDDAFGRLDLLVNSASVFRRRPWPELEPPEWEDQLDTNLHAPFRFARHAAPRLRASGAGLIVNLVDASGMRPWKHYLAHSVAKAGLIALTRGLARELAPDVRVNAICPGPVLWPEDYDARTKKAVLARVPLARAGNPEDVVRALRYLVAADYVTGDVLAVEGGRLLR